MLLPILLGGVAVISGIGSAISTHFANESNIKFMREQEERARQRYLEDREYNSVKSQRERLRKEGLNPERYLAGNVGTTAPMSFSISSPRIEPIDFTQILNGIVDIYNASKSEARAEVEHAWNQATFEQKTELVQSQLEIRDSQLDLAKENLLLAQSKVEMAKTSLEIAEAQKEAILRTEEFYRTMEKALGPLASKESGATAQVISRLILEIIKTFTTRKSEVTKVY